MKMQEVREMAKKLGLKPGKIRKKTDLIRAIQSAEGNMPCFQTEVSSCDQADCCWRGICLK